jgi:hypothetical protein
MPGLPGRRGRILVEIWPKICYRRSAFESLPGHLDAGGRIRLQGTVRVERFRGAPKESAVGSKPPAGGNYLTQPARLAGGAMTFDAAIGVAGVGCASGGARSLAARELARGFFDTRGRA